MLKVWLETKNLVGPEYNVIIACLETIVYFQAVFTMHILFIYRRESRLADVHSQTVYMLALLKLEFTHEM